MAQCDYGGFASCCHHGGGLISIGFGMGTVALIWVARASGLERIRPERDKDQADMINQR